MEGHYPASSFVEAAIARWRRQGFKIDPEPYIYNAEFNPLPAAGSLNAVNTTGEAEAFACFYVTFAGRPADDVTSYRNTKALLQISGDEKGHALQDRPADIQNIAGVAQRPFRFYVPFIVRPQSSWTTTASNLDTVNNLVLRVAFHGAKIRLRRR